MNGGEQLTAYYDLTTSPPTYDIVAFIPAAERERIRRKVERVNIEILPGPIGGFRYDKLWPILIEERRKMLYGVAVPMAHMLPSAIVNIRADRPSRPVPNSIGWLGRLYGTRLQVECMRAGIRPLRCANPLPYKPKLVTITLREADHWPQRNSALDEWLPAGATIKSKGFEVIFVRDTFKVAEPLPNVATFPQAAINLEARAALYRSAACNMFVSNGPAWFCLALDAPTLMLKPTVEGVMNTCSAAFFERCGLRRGMQIDDAVKYQRIVWEDDKRDAIVAAFDGFMALQ